MDLKPKDSKLATEISTALADKLGEHYTSTVYSCIPPNYFLRRSHMFHVATDL